MYNTCLYCFSILLIIYKYHLRPGLNVAQQNPLKLRVNRFIPPTINGGERLFLQEIESNWIMNEVNSFLG